MLPSRQYAPMRRFSSTDNPAKTRRPSGTCTTPRRTISSGASRSRRTASTLMLPAEVRRSPEIARSAVVFPAPLAPSRATIWPSLTLSVIPFSALI